MYIHSRFSKIKITKKSNNSKEPSLKSQRQIPVFKHLMINSIGLSLSPKNATCILKIQDLERTSYIYLSQIILNKYAIKIKVTYFLHL